MVRNSGGFGDKENTLIDFIPLYESGGLLKALEGSVDLSYLIKSKVSFSIPSMGIHIHLPDYKPAQDFPKVGATLESSLSKHDGRIIEFSPKNINLQGPGGYICQL
jgi:hypothetical protein